MAVTAAVATGAVPAVAGAAANANLIAQWRFDESAGQVVHDDGPFGLDGVLGLTPEPDTADPERIGNGALRFDGSSIVRLPNSPRLAPEHLTVEAVARADGSPGSYRYLVSRGGTGCYSGSYGLYTAPTADSRSMSLTAPATCCRPPRVGGTSGTARGTTSRARSTAPHSGCSSMVAKSATPMDAPISIDYSTRPTDAATLGQYAGACDLGFDGDIDQVRISSDVPARRPAPDSPSDSPPAPLAGSSTRHDAPRPGPQGSVPPTASSKTCTVRLARRNVVAGRRTVVRARLLNASKRGKLRLSVRRGTRGKAVTSARISASGRARLVVRSQRAGHLTVRVVGRTGCASARLTVSNAKGAHP